MKALKISSLILGILVYLAGSYYLIWLALKGIFWSLPVWMFGVVNVLAFYKAAGVTLLIVLFICIFIPGQKRRVIILIPFDPDNPEEEKTKRGKRGEG